MDTSEDAPYFGIRTNPTNLNIVSYIEGDVTRHIAESVEEYVDFIRKLKADYEWYNYSMKNGRCGHTSRPTNSMR